MSHKRISAVALLATFIAGTANAVPVLVDFTDSSWASAEGSTTSTRSYDGFDVTLSATGGALSFNGGDAPAWTSASSSLARGGDGIGIGNDEIGRGERLTVSFSTAVSIRSIFLLDLFAGEGAGGSGLESFTVDYGAGSVSGSAQSVDSNGLFAVTDLLLEGVSSLSFYATGGSWSDFSLAALGIELPQVFSALAGNPGVKTTALKEAVQVSAPGTLALLLLATILLYAQRGSLRKKAVFM